MAVDFGFGAFTKEDTAWREEFNKLDYYEFQQLGIEKDKLEDILDKLYEWRVIR